MSEIIRDYPAIWIKQKIFRKLGVGVRRKEGEFWKRRPISEKEKRRRYAKEAFEKAIGNLDPACVGNFSDIEDALKSTTNAIDFQTHFAGGSDYQSFLAQHGSPSDRARWQRAFDGVALSATQLEVLARFCRRMPVICMAGAWCGDCAGQCPIFARFEAVCPLIEIRFVDRQQDPLLADQLQICGAPRIPQLVFLNEDFLPVARYGDRTLARYRHIAEQLSGAACSTGIVSGDDPVFAAEIQQWLNEFERAQLLLRTSPHLRQLHGD